MEKELEFVKPGKEWKDSLKSIIDNSPTDGAKAFQDSWDMPIGDGETFGDMLTNALEYSLEIEYEISIIHNDKHHALLVGSDKNKHFNMKELSQIFDTIVRWEFKPKTVSKLDYFYMSNEHPQFVKISKEESTDELLVLELLNPAPILPEKTVTVSIEDVLYNDIFIFNADDVDDYEPSDTNERLTHEI